MEEPAEQLHALPLVDFPYIAITANYLWSLPEGRSADDHHLFPRQIPVTLLPQLTGGT